MQLFFKKISFIKKYPPHRLFIVCIPFLCATRILLTILESFHKEAQNYIVDKKRKNSIIEALLIMMYNLKKRLL